MNKNKEEKVVASPILDKETKEEVTEAIIEELLNQKLTENQRNFILYYLESNNITQSYMKAYPNANKKWAYIKGNVLLKQENIQNIVRQLKKILIQTYDIDPTRYIETQLKIANADLGDYMKFYSMEMPVYGEDGSIVFDETTGEPMKKKVNKVELYDSEKVDTSIIASIRSGREGVLVQLYDKQKAWENIKNFFEWKAKKEDKDKLSESILSAINNSTKDTWEDVNGDLYDTLREEQ